MCFVSVLSRTSPWSAWQLMMLRLSFRWCWHCQRCQFFNVSSQCVEEKCGILNATVTQRTKFMELIDLEPSVQVIRFTIEHLSHHLLLLLQHVDIAHWAGLGGVRYIPADYVDSETEKVLEMSEEDLRLTNQRNMELVATLRNTDSAFSLGEGPPPLNVMCVRFGMVTMETEVEELLSLVINCGKDIDEAVTQLHTMSEVKHFKRKY